LGFTLDKLINVFLYILKIKYIDSKRVKSSLKFRPIIKPLLVVGIYGHVKGGQVAVESIFASPDPGIVRP